jgi:hypothetical protein
MGITEQFTTYSRLFKDQTLDTWMENDIPAQEYDTSIPGSFADREAMTSDKDILNEYSINACSIRETPSAQISGTSTWKFKIGKIEGKLSVAHSMSFGLNVEGLTVRS